MKQTARSGLLLTLPLLAVLGSGCSPSDETATSAQAEASIDADPLPEQLASIRSRAESLPIVEGEEAYGDATARYRIHVDGETPVYVEEAVEGGAHGEARNSYFFEDGELIHFRREGRQLIADPPNPPAVDSVFIAVDYDDRGSITDVVKRLAGKDAEIDTYELTAIRSRMVQFRRIARDAQREPLPEGEYQGYLVLGHELRTFQPCGSPTIYWAQADEQIRDVVWSMYEEKSGFPHQPLFAHVKGSIGGRPEGELASNYPAVFQIHAVSVLEPKEALDCQ